MTFVQSDEVTWPDQKKNFAMLWHLRHWLQYRQLRTWINDNLCYLTINCDTGQHSQFLRCFFSKTFILRLRQKWLNGQFSFDEWKVMKGNLWLVPAVKCPTMTSLNWKWFKIMGGGRVGSHPEINNVQIEKKYIKKIPARMMRTLPLPPFIYFTKKNYFFHTNTLEDCSVWYLSSKSRLIFFQNLVLKNGR